MGGFYLSVGTFATRNKRYRKDMEDAHHCELDYMGRKGEGYFGLFDGHGGKQSAKWCSQRFHQLLNKSVAKNESKWQIAAILASTFETADKLIGKMVGFDQSGTTAAIAYLKSVKIPKPCRYLYTANVGDTRMVICHDGVAERVSHDHNCYDNAECERVESEGGIVLNNRVNGVLAITRALGDGYFKPHVCPKPYTTESILDEEKDEFLILASDGLWDVCSDQAAVDEIRGIADPYVAARALVRHAINLGSIDNISCMVIRFIDPLKLHCTSQTAESGSIQENSDNSGVSLENKSSTCQATTPTTTPAVALTKPNREPHEVTQTARIFKDMILESSSHLPISTSGVVEQPPPLQTNDEESEISCACCTAAANRPNRTMGYRLYHRPLNSPDNFTVGSTSSPTETTKKYGLKRTPEPLAFDDSFLSEAVVDSDE